MISLFLRKELVKERDRLYPFVKVKDIVFFIGRMKVMAFQSESHEHDFDAQFFFKKGADRNAASTPHRNR